MKILLEPHTFMDNVMSATLSLASSELSTGFAGSWRVQIKV